MHLRFPLLLCFFCLFSPYSAQAQGGTWANNSVWLDGAYYAYAGPGAYFTEEIALRGGQMSLGFNSGTECHQKMEARVVGQAWSRFYDGGGGCRVMSVWPGAPMVPGSYQIEMRWVGSAGLWHEFAYDLHVVPPATQAFSDADDNSMIYWQGTTAAIDQPLLVVEGIDAADMNYESTYYAIGSDLFARGRARGADVFILNFAHGGIDLRENAEVVEAAIHYLNQIKTGSRPLDVAGVSMGGVVLRYALADMEDRGVAHNVGRFVSMDGPQQGAVLDLDLQEWIFYSERSMVPAPPNLTSVAGMQLLKRDLFDLSARPNRHNAFYAELNGLNGDGYPHQTIENVGVSFGSPYANPDAGQEWLTVHLPVVLDPHFHIEEGTPEAGAGSWLPLGVTDLWGKTLYGFSDWEFERLANPTFIPYESALDIVSGQTRFTPPTIHPTEGPSYHDRIPGSVIEPLLARLGYPEPPPGPLATTIDGPLMLTGLQTGTWNANVTGGTGTPTYRWDYRTWVSSCGLDLQGGGTEEPERGEAADSTGGSGVEGIGPGTGTQSLPCGEWHYGGASSSFSWTMHSETHMEMRLQVWKGSESTTTYTTVQNSENGNLAGGGAEAGKASTSAHASAAGGAPALPVAFSFDGARPNPFRNSTRLRFALPEPAAVRLVVYDALGREVARPVDGRLNAGWHEAALDGAALPAGVYLVRMEAGAFAAAHRITVAR